MSKIHVCARPSTRAQPTTTRWAPTSYKWSYNPYKWPYNPYKWPYKRVNGVITLLITGIFCPPCKQKQTKLRTLHSSTSPSISFNRNLHLFTKSPWNPPSLLPPRHISILWDTINHLVPAATKPIVPYGTFVLLDNSYWASWWVETATHWKNMIWLFPKIGGFLPQIIQFNKVFHYFHHPFWGVKSPLFLVQHPY